MIDWVASKATRCLRHTTANTLKFENDSYPEYNLKKLCVGVVHMPEVLSLDNIQESVRLFLEGVVSSPTPSAIDMNGHRVHFVVRPLLRDFQAESWNCSKN
jgi:hypothetical protein